MKPESIQILYQNIFDTYPSVEIKEHIKKLIELDEFYPFNATFFCITNTPKQSFEYISKNFTACTGLPREEMQNKGMDYFWSRIHPNDIKLWISCLQDLMEFTMNELSDSQKRKMSYTWNYRIKNAKNEYITVIQNTTPLQFDEQNKPIIGLAHYTVLDSDLHMDICASAKFLNDNNEYETLFYKNESNNHLLGLLSNRERDIIRLLVTNKSSKEIASVLNISKHTVDTHRRNILNKLNLTSTIQITDYFKNNNQML